MIKIKVGFIYNFDVDKKKCIWYLYFKVRALPYSLMCKYTSI